MGDHERIWLQHPDDADPSQGRMWCEDKVWPDSAEDGEPTEYIRADLAAAPDLTEAAEQIVARLDEIEEDRHIARAGDDGVMVRVNIGHLRALRAALKKARGEA